MEQNYHEWTSCQALGHDYHEDADHSGRRICSDCGEAYED